MTRPRTLVLTRHEAADAVAPRMREMVAEVETKLRLRRRRYRALLFAIGFDVAIVGLIAAAALVEALR